MDQKTKPVDAITLLKHDHDEAKQAFKDFEELGERAHTSKLKLADKVCAALMAHMAIEEEIFYPAAAQALEDGEDLINEAIVEHASARALIKQIRAMAPEDELFDAKVKVLGEQIEHHVKEEETEMFPKVRKTDLDLNALGERMAERKVKLLADGI